MKDENKSRCQLVAIDRATRWVFVKSYSSKSAANARRFLSALQKKCDTYSRKGCTVSAWTVSSYDRGGVHIVHSNFSGDNVSGLLAALASNRIAPDQDTPQLQGNP